MPRLDSNLSRVLLDQGFLSVDQLEEAAQQQVIHGGALDTLLLELGLIDEVTVAASLAMGWGTDPVDVRNLRLDQGEAQMWIPERMAVRMALCPFKEEAGAIHVLLAAPVDKELLEEVGTLTGSALVPHVVPEVRLQSALGRIYDVPVEERFVSLLAHLDEGLEGPLRAPTENAAQTEVEASDWDLVEALANLAAQDNRQGISRVAVQYARQFLPFASIYGVRGSQAVGWARAGGSGGAQFGKVPLPIPEGSVLRQVLDSPSPLLGKPPLNEGNKAFFGWVGRRRPRTALLIPVIVARRTVAVLYADGGIRAHAYDSVSDLVAFGARLGPAFEALLRARHKENEALFGPRHEGRGEHVAPAPDALDDEDPKKDGTSPFARGYKREFTAPPEPKVAPTLQMDGEGRWSMVLTPAEESGPSGASPRPADLHAWGDAVETPGPAQRDDTAAAYDDGGVSPAAPTEFDLGVSEDDDTIDSQLSRSPLASDVPTESSGPLTGPSPKPSAEPDVDWDDDAEDEDIVLDSTLVDEPAVPATLENAMLEGGPRPAFQPLGSGVGLQRSHSEAVVGASSDLPEDEPGPAYADDEEAEEEDITYDGEVTGMFPVGRVTPEVREQFEETASELDEAEAKLESLETGGFRNLLASVQDEVSGPNPAVPTQDLDVGQLPARGAFDQLTDTSAPKAWKGALSETLEGGGANRPAEDLGLTGEGGWDDASINAATAASLAESIADGSPVVEASELSSVPVAEPPLERKGGADAKAPPLVSGVPAEAPRLEILSGLDELPASPPPNKPQLEILDDGKGGVISPEQAFAAPEAQSLLTAPPAGVAPVVSEAEAEVTLTTGDVEITNEADLASALELDASHEGPEGTRVPGPDAGEVEPARSEAAPSLTIDDAAEMLDSMYKARVREAQAFLRAQGQNAIPALAGRFPGKLLLDPFAGDVTLETAAELGPMMELLESMGVIGLEAAIPHLDSPFPGHRFCATFLFVLVPDERALELLKKRLHDHEPNIRTVAAAAMTHFLAHPRFAHVLQHLRDRLSSPSAEAQERAIALLGTFRDVGSIPSLIDLLDEKHPAVPAAAHQALVQVALLDHGRKSKAWRKWWEKARKRTRMDWLIDALRSRDEDIRFVAQQELMSLTGNDFGFDPWAKKGVRERAVRDVERWWTEERAAMAS